MHVDAERADDLSTVLLGATMIADLIAILVVARLIFWWAEQIPKPYP